MQEHATFIYDQFILETITHLVAGVHHRLMLPPLQILNQAKTIHYRVDFAARCDADGTGLAVGVGGNDVTGGASGQ